MTATAENEAAMGEGSRADPEPDPDMRIAVIGSFTPQEAALLAGRLEAEGVRAMVSIGHSAPGPWAAFGGTLGPLLPANPLQQRTAEVLVDERDLDRARRIAARFVDR
jgi:putative signal transducing protein